MKSIYVAIAACLMFSACEERIEIKPTGEQEKVVIESTLSNQTEHWTVKLSQTQGFSNQKDKHTVDDALVVISDNHGLVDTLQPSGQGEYRSQEMRACQPGYIYTLDVYVEDEHYTARDSMRSQEEIIMLGNFYIEESNPFRAQGWYVFEIARESAAKGDFYLWKIFRNDTFVDDYGYLLDDDVVMDQGFFNEWLIDGDIDENLMNGRMPNAFPQTFQAGDHVLVEQYCMNKGAHDFISEVQNQKNRGGTPFDAPAANPRSNISGTALGFFSVVNVARAEVVIE